MKELPPPSTAADAVRPQRVAYAESARYRRIRSLSKLMDQCIVLPGGFRIGLDPLCGLVPGIGDVLGAIVSTYIVYEAARLGLPKRILARMAGNIVIEAAAGTLPVIGDIFDAVWKANMRNFQLLEMHYHPTMPERPRWRIAAWIAIPLLLLIAANIAAVLFFFRLIAALIS